MKNVSARWIVPTKTESQTSFNLRPTDDNKYIRPTLQNVNISFRKGLLIDIVGPVATGKSSLLQAILRELPLEQGQISVCGSVSYASQVPWIFSASVRQNILFGQPMDRHRFDEVIKECDLLDDLEQFEYGEGTLVG